MEARLNEIYKYTAFAKSFIFIAQDGQSESPFFRNIKDNFILINIQGAKLIEKNYQLLTDIFVE